MSNLQWHDVAAPDFSGAVSANNQFGSFLNNALGGLKGSLKEFDQAESDKVNAAIMMQLAQINDPAKAKMAATDLLANVDPRRVNAVTLAGIMARPGELLNQAATESNLNWTNYTRDKARTEDTVRAEVAPLQQQMLMKAAANDMPGAQAIFAANADKFAKLGYTDFASTLRDTMGTARDSQQYTQSGTLFDRGTVDYNEKRLADAITEDYRKKYLTPDDAAAALNNDAQIKPNVAALVRQNLGLTAFANLDNYGGGGLGGMGGGSGTPGGLDPTRIMNYEARGAGFNTVPDSVKTMGQASDFARSVNKAGVESSAMGLYQIVGKTMRSIAPQVLGPDWRNQAYSPENQDKIAAAIFKANSGSAEALRRQWPSLTLAQAEQLRKVPWEQARGVIAGKESGISTQNLGAVLAGQMGNLQTGINMTAANLESTAGNSLPMQFFAAAQSQESPAQVARRLAKDNPGINAAWAEERILKLMDEVRASGGNRRQVNAAMAGIAIMDNAGAQSARESWYQRLVPDAMASNTLGEDQIYDHKASLEALKGYATGNMDDAILGMAGREQAAKTKAQGEALVQQAQARLQAKIAAAAARGIKNPNLAPELLALQQAMAVAGMSENMVQAPGMQLSGKAPNDVGALTTQLMQSLMSGGGSKPPVNQQQQNSPTPQVRKSGPAPNDHSSAAARARMSQLMPSAESLMKLLPTYWMGRAIDGR